MSDLDLARRAVACPGWRWMAGMRVRVALDVDVHVMARIVTSGCGAQMADEDADRGVYRMAAGPLRDRCAPDLTDPATLGCLLHLVRLAWGTPKATVRWYFKDMCAFEGARWPLDIMPSHPGKSEAEALVAALEAAPAAKEGQ